MTLNQDLVLSVTQMLLGSLIKSRRITTLTPDLIREQVTAASKLLSIESVDVDKLTAELLSRFDVFVQQAAILAEEDHHDKWARQVDRSNWRFWKRCQTYLMSLLPVPVVRQIDEDTDSILELLGDPSVQTPWDRRGLVVGDVQFGKTSNYAALACKAADAGYKIIIVLAGIHESLRMQTQIRMDEAFLGFRTDSSRALTGVGLFDPGVTAVAATARSQKGDFNKIVAGQLVVPLDIGPPIMLVVKKNARMLRNLHTWLEKVAQNTDTSGRRVIRGAAALIIDDESDNASVDTGDQSFGLDQKPDLQHKPTAINGLIRKILHVFENKSYVGYTATPFANIFIHHGGETTEAAKDLFPKNFIVNLHAPSNYFGPLRAFGLEDNSDRSELSETTLVRLIDRSSKDRDELRGWMPSRHKLTLEPGPVPETLRRAILSFVLTCALRKLRGQVTEHNSMLVHVTRFTRVQGVVAEQIEDALLRIRRRLRFGDESASDSILIELRRIWEDDYVPTSAAMNEAKQSDTGELPSWETVEQTLSAVSAGIRVKQINGLAQDVLDYDSHREEGIDVIVVGGDKLSRGLTLYGLSVSYFTRQTDMYDTLLQMGRWFGYRTGYLDLCRLYTTEHLNNAFTHIAIASDELRRDFDYMARIGSKPIDYGLKVQNHPVLSPTSSNKRRHARDVVLYQSYAGGVSESKSFSLEGTTLLDNKATLDRLIEELGQAHASQQVTSKRSFDGSYLWLDVAWSTVETFLEGYKSEPTSLLARSDFWLLYIRKQIANWGELSRWNVALFGGDIPRERNVGGLKVRPRKRERDKDVDQGSGYRIKRLVTTRDAGIDMNDDAWTKALRYDPVSLLSGKPRSEPTARAICNVRQSEGINPLLMLYLPEPMDSAFQEAVVGVAIAFPGSDRAEREKIVYAVNTVFQTSLRSEEEEEIDEEAL